MKNDECLSVMVPREDGFAPELVLISAEELSKMLSISKRTVWRLLSAGKIVRPIRLGGSVRWRLDDVRSWIESGCPSNDGRGC